MAKLFDKMFLNVLLLGFAFMFVFTAFQTCGMIQNIVISSMKKQYENYDGNGYFLYVNQSFSPSPDIEVGNIYDCFNINGKLVLHYSTSPAWG